MEESRPNELVLSRKVLRVLMFLNPLFGLFILTLLVTSFVAESFIMKALMQEHGVADHTFVLGLRWIMVLGIGGVVLVQLAMRRLFDIVETVGAGDPFVIINAERLKTIAWLILGLEALHLAVGLIAHNVSTETHPLDLDWNFNFMRWIAVLFLFVLARVFEQGARMREELEGTV